MIFQELNNDQRREIINSQQRFQAWIDARQAVAGFKGSMVWNDDKGTEYLVRSAYDPRSGVRKQKSLGPRSAVTEKMKEDFDRGREKAKARLAEAQKFLRRQADINRALVIGRVPAIGARIMRALDDAGLLGDGIRIVGTNAIFAYEAASGVFVEASITTTDDLDLLFDARHRLRFASTVNVSERNLMALLRRVDRSFERMPRTFSARNRDGFVVDFIERMPHPPWANDREQIGARDSEDLTAVAIEGLRWLENSPPFEATAIDEKGIPLRIVAPDPRAFAIHKLWLSTQPGRSPLKRHRDRAQSEAVAQIVSRYLTFLDYDHRELSALPKELFDRAKPLFDGDAGA